MLQEKKPTYNLYFNYFFTKKQIDILNISVVQKGKAKNEK